MYLYEIMIGSRRSERELSAGSYGLHWSIIHILDCPTLSHASLVFVDDPDDSKHSPFHSEVLPSRYIS